MHTPKIDLFSPIVEPNKLNEQFVEIMKSQGHVGCRRLMNEVFNDMPNPDENFVDQFQTQGFEARVFELGIFAYLQEVGLEIEQYSDGTDFITTDSNNKICVEATTTSPPDHLKLTNITYTMKSPLMEGEDMMNKITDQLPIRYGSALFQNLRKSIGNYLNVKTQGL